MNAERLLLIAVVQIALTVGPAIVHGADGPKDDRRDFWVNGVATDDDLKQFEEQPAADTRELGLSESHVTDTGLRYLRAMKKLEIINLSDTAVSDAGLKELFETQSHPAMAELWIRNTKVTDNGLKYVGRSKSLRLVEVGGTAISDAGLEHLAGSGLHKLYLETNDRITDAGMASVGKINSLCLLGLDSKRITDEGCTHLRGLKHIEQLFLCSDKFTNAAMQAVGGLTPEILEIGGRNVNDDGLKFLKGNKKLARLFLARNTISGRGLDDLAALPKLIDLRLSDFTDEGLEHVGRLEHIEQLTFVRPKFTAAGLAHLKKLKLTFLGLDRTAAGYEEMLKKAFPKCNVHVWTD
jgi:hypothetical protein